MPPAIGGRVVATTTEEFGDFYNERLAGSDLKRYHEQGPKPWTRALIEALKAEGVEGATLLDIGGGVGVVHHELLAAGASRATCVDASAAYLEAARAESERRGHAERVTYVHGDFVELADSIPRADIVTLDRVINVYPDWQQLAALSAARARRLYGLVYPRDRRSVRFVIFALNLFLRLRRKQVRAAVQHADAIERVLRDNGLTVQVSISAGPVWQVAIYRRA
jgi:2-polyprenyl-3-methyl-5-hydroxy-6-metoxy-1,4-benzoquinol methylase